MRQNVIAELIDDAGQRVAGQLDMPTGFDVDQLTLLVNELKSEDEPLPYSFYIEDDEITTTIEDFMQQYGHTGEKVLKIVCKPQAVFRVRPVTRCSASMPAHTEPVLCLAFSPDGCSLASGSGDRTVRLWDLHTQTPIECCQGHAQWILCLQWAPDSQRLASGSMDGTIGIWDRLGKRQRMLRGHRKWVNAISWQPLHLSDGTGARKLVSASKDATCKIWDVQTGRLLASMGGHTAAVTCVRWGGHGHIYSGSQDRTVRVWTEQGNTVRVLHGHAHWINSMALSSDHLCRTGPFDYTDPKFESHQERLEAAKRRWQTEMAGGRRERLVTGSDDHTMYLWDPTEAKAPLARMTGHQQLINSVCFSPDGRHIASGSFDKSVRLWTSDGKFVATLRGHVASVYQVAWSSDSRMIISGSKDTTCKVWSLRARAQLHELPGHADEIYAVDWSPNGSFAASAGKDKIVKLWRGAA